MSLFDDLNQKIKTMERDKRYINECLKDYGVADLHDAKFSISYINRIDDTELIKSFNQYVKHSATLSQDLKNLVEQGRAEDIREIEKFDELKRHERFHYWVLWLHRSLRWLAGSLIVVFFYSILVAAAESNSSYLNWVKIPVREWLIGQVN